MNLVMIKGNVGQEPTIKTLENGSKVMQLSVATSEKWFNRDKNEWVEGETQWHNVVAWNRLAEKPVQKGHTVQVIGKLTYRSYMKDDEKRFVTDIVASDLEIIVRMAKATAPAPTAADAPVWTSTLRQDSATAKQDVTQRSNREPAQEPIGGDVKLPVGGDDLPF